MTQDTTNRIDIQTGHGATNTLDAHTFYEVVGESCQHIYETLADHCGPYATDALIIRDNGGNLKDPHNAIFTKDGIGIVRAIEFMSPIQQHIQHLIAYIGSRVDTLSHDGTTTSMMFVAGIIAACFRHIKQTQITGEPFNRRQFRDDITTVLRNAAAVIERRVHTIDDLAETFALSREDAIRFVAYQQAMLSSKGDVELTTAIVDVVETLPKELYSMFHVSQSGIETGQRFTVIKDDFNFRLSVLQDLDNMNHNMGTEYLAESCDLIVSEDDLIPGNPAVELILNHIKRYETTEPDCDLVIITKSIDGNLLGRIKMLNRTKRHKIITFTYSTPTPYSSKVTILSALMYTAGVCPMTEHMFEPTHPYLITNAKIHHKNRRLYISNLYHKDGSQYHPFFNNPDAFHPYTKFVANVRQTIDEYSSGRMRVESAADQARIADYIEIYSRMVCANVRHLQISGMTHEVMADRDVMQDAFGSVLSALDHGFVLDGYLQLRLWFGLASNTSEAASSVLNIVHGILETVHHATTDASRAMDFQLHLNDIISRRETASSYTFYPVDHAPTTLLHISPLTRTETGWSIDAIGDNHVPVQLVIQPADTYREMFRRIEDLLPKLLNTSRVIIPGTTNNGVNT